MTEDFFDSHERHLVDAEYLYQNEHWANADHLFGVAAECGLKALTVGLKGSPLAKGERKHISEPSKPTNAWDIFESYRSGHVMAAKLALPPANPFVDWDVSQRYAHRTNFTKAVVDPHRNGANEVMELLIVADVEGLL
jgi:hypothetical protein